MALSFDLKGIKDHEQVCYAPVVGLTPITEGLIWATMIIGIGEITDKNHQEFYNRLVLHQKVHGSLLKNGSIDLDMVQAHIGLKTNVAPKVTHKKFMSNLAKAALEKVICG